MAKLKGTMNITDRMRIRNGQLEIKVTDQELFRVSGQLVHENYGGQMPGAGPLPDTPEPELPTEPTTPPGMVVFPEDGEKTKG